MQQIWDGQFYLSINQSVCLSVCLSVLQHPLVWIMCRYQGITGYSFQIKLYFFSLKIVFVLAKFIDHDEVLHYVPFHLGLRCLPK